MPRSQSNRKTAETFHFIFHVSYSPFYVYMNVGQPFWITNCRHSELLSLLRKLINVTLMWNVRVDVGWFACGLVHC